uniref:Uncharacterized protein n=1 Tax=Glossina austeni TaxID=7395 RepID=A0A1A9VUT0_GLOAU
MPSASGIKCPICKEGLQQHRPTPFTARPVATSFMLFAFWISACVDESVVKDLQSTCYTMCYEHKVERLQEECTMTDEEMLKRNVSKIVLLEQYKKTLDIMKQMQEQNEFFLSQNKEKAKENEVNSETLKIMEQKVSQLSIEETKRQDLLDQYGGGMELETSVKSPNNELQKMKINNDTEDIPSARSEDESDEIDINKCNEMFNVFIKDFHFGYLCYPMAGVIVNVELAPADVRNVRLVEQRYVNHRLPDKVSLVVELGSLQAKIDFPNNRMNARNHPDYKSVMIYEFMDDDANSLLGYQNTNIEDAEFPNNS